jgi:hypothetical protein
MFVDEDELINLSLQLWNDRYKFAISGTIGPELIGLIYLTNGSAEK